MKSLYYEVRKCLGCKTCEIACSIAHSSSGSLFKAMREDILSLPRKKVLPAGGKSYPLACRHCKDPKCVDACIAKALVYDKEKGMVMHDEARCVGCWMCVMVCPYAAIRPNIQTQIPVRCDKCKDRVGGPACAEACPTAAVIWAEEKEVTGKK